ncbi:MAG: hypothetical protein WC471_02975 [Candidatus Woesearchaeota archaeon]
MNEIEKTPERVINASDTKDFYAESIPGALDKCVAAGYSPLSMREIIRLRITAGSRSLFWKKCYTTASLIEHGKTATGAKIVLVSHVQNYLMIPANVRMSVAAGLRNGAGIVTKSDFLHRVELAEDGAAGLYIIPRDKVMRSSSGVISIDSAIDHPLTLPFLGVTEKEVQEYLEMHRRVYGGSIGIRHYDDYVEGEVRGRLLFLGDNYYCLGSYVLDDDARFIGVRRSVATEEGNAQNSDNIEQSIEILKRS